MTKQGQPRDPHPPGGRMSYGEYLQLDRLLDAGYVFTYPEIDGALASAL